jgi:hypothetical protein
MSLGGEGGEGDVRMKEEKGEGAFTTALQVWS